MYKIFWCFLILFYFQFLIIKHWKIVENDKRSSLTDQEIMLNSYIKLSELRRQWIYIYIYIYPHLTKPRRTQTSKDTLLRKKGMFRVSYNNITIIIVCLFSPSTNHTYMNGPQSAFFFHTNGTHLINQLLPTDFAFLWYFN